MNCINAFTVRSGAISVGSNEFNMSSVPYRGRWCFVEAMPNTWNGKPYVELIVFRTTSIQAAKRWRRAARRVGHPCVVVRWRAGIIRRLRMLARLNDRGLIFD